MPAPRPGPDGTPATTHTSKPHPLDGVALRARVAEVIDTHLSAQREIVVEIGEPVLDLIDEISDLLSGGKRLRAAFLYWGYRAFGGSDSTALVRAASAMELFQAAALLHDDVMDHSDLRRGRPTAHRAFAARHEQAAWSGSSTEFGLAAATLAGDMCLNWSDELFAGSGLPAEQLHRARPTFDTMRTQLMGGQYLDVLTSAQEWTHLSHEERLDQCLRVIRYKSAKYSIEHPVLLGASAIGAPKSAQKLLSDFGLALGEAFQLRDDILGVFGDPQSTGKPAGDDIREGKRTVLIATALRLGTPSQERTLTHGLGDPELSDADLADIREALTASGAVHQVEDMISLGRSRATEALDRIEEMTTEGRHALHALIDISTSRQV
ncbi:MAG: polyprenyl synthetase family protein [Ornithinimicrobium sp.]